MMNNNEIDTSDYESTPADCDESISLEQVKYYIKELYNNSESSILKYNTLHEIEKFIEDLRK